MRPSVSYCVRCEVNHAEGIHSKPQRPLPVKSIQKPQEAAPEANASSVVPVDRKAKKAALMAPYMRDRRLADKEGHGGNPETNPNYLTVKQWRLKNATKEVAA